MKLGIASALPHFTPTEWAQKNKELGLEAVVFPCSYTADLAKIDAYVSASKEYNLTIAEVGAWCNPMALDETLRQRNFENCVKQLELAEYVGAKCCVNIAGSKGEIWDGAYVENYSEQTYQEIVTCVQDIIDAVNPKNTYYTLEPMPWMCPDSPEMYLQLIQDVNRDAFAVHMDIVNMINDPKKYLFNAAFTNKAFSLLGNHIKSCHIKDLKLSPQLTLLMSEVPLGEGGFDLKNYIQQANAVSDDMPMIIEHVDSIPAYLQAIDYINKLLEEDAS